MIWCLRLIFYLKYFCSDLLMLGFCSLHGVSRVFCGAHFRLLPLWKNRRQKVFNWGLYVCAMGLDIFQFGGGLSPLDHSQWRIQTRGLGRSQIGGRHKCFHGCHTKVVTFVGQKVAIFVGQTMRFFRE